MVFYIIHTSIFALPALSTLTGRHQMLQQYWYLQQQRHWQTRTCSQQSKEQCIQKSTVKRSSGVIPRARGASFPANGYSGGVLPCVQMQPVQQCAEIIVSKSFFMLLLSHTSYGWSTTWLQARGDRGCHVVWGWYDTFSPFLYKNQGTSNGIRG